MNKKIYILKQENLSDLYFYNSVKKLYFKSIKGDGFLHMKNQKNYLINQDKNKNYVLKMFLSNKTYLNNLVNCLDRFFKGVANGFFFELSIRGIGYKCYYFGINKLFLNLGYSHYIIYNLPDNVLVFLKKGKIYIYSISKEIIGSVVQDLKNLRIPDAYKAKGIVDSSKIFNLKEGKKR